MCEATNPYSDSDVVWVKMGSCWWPGEVCGESRLPEGLLASMKKPPIAVVRFFQEQTFEYVKNLNNIYKYNCTKKHEFIKKGLDMHRNKKLHMEKFPGDVQQAEKLTGGDPGIIDSKEFAPEVRKKWTDLFDDSPTKKPKGKGRSPIKPKISPIVGTPRPITHPRFIRKAIDGTTDHEVRILAQPSNSFSTPTTSEATATGQRNSFSGGSAYTPPTPQAYKCHVCNFSSARLNVIILHSKNHSNEPPLAQKGKRTPVVITPKPKVTPKTPASATAKKQTTLSQIVTSDNTVAVPKTSKVSVTKITETPKASKKSPVKKSATKQRASKRNTVNVSKDQSPQNDDSLFVVRKSDSKTGNDVKPEEKLKSTLLADWSEDESDVLGFEPTDIETNVRVINKSVRTSNVSPTKRIIDLSDLPNPKEPVRVEKELASLEQEGIVKKILGGKDDKSPVAGSSTASVMKYRNIPKKQRYLFSENIDDGPAEPVAVVSPIKTGTEVKAVVAESQDEPKKEAHKIAQTSSPKAISTKERILGYRTTRRRTESAKQSPSVAEEAQPTHKIDGPKVELEQVSTEDANKMEVDVKDETPPDADATKVDEKDTVEEPKDEKRSPKRETSCFDFAEDDDDIPLNQITSTRRRSRKSLPLAEGTPKDEVAVESGMVVSDAVVEKSDETPIEALTDVADKENEDETLQNEIASLLLETEIPKIPGTGCANNDATSTSIDIKERKLPPKERGKRIFKSRNKSETSAISSEQGPSDNKSDEIPIGSPTATKKTEEVEPSPPTTSARSQKKPPFVEDSIGKFSATPTETDLQVAEALIALPEATIQAAKTRDNHVEVTERRSSRRDSKRQQQQLAEIAAAEKQKRRDIEEKVEKEKVAEFLVGLSMSTSPPNEAVLPQVVVDTLDETDTSITGKRLSRKRHLKVEEDTHIIEPKRTRNKKNKFDELVDEIPTDREVVPSPIDKKRRQGKKFGSDDYLEEGLQKELACIGSSSKRVKRLHNELEKKETRNNSPIKLELVETLKPKKAPKKLENPASWPNELIDLEGDISESVLIEKSTVSQIDTQPEVSSPVTTSPKGSSKRKSKREQTQRLPIAVAKLQPVVVVPEPRKDDSIFDIDSMPIVMSDEPLILNPVVIDEPAASTSKTNNKIVIVSPSPAKTIEVQNDLIRSSLSPTHSKSPTAIKTIKLKPSDTQKIKELQQKSSIQRHSPPVVMPSKTSLIKSQIILPASATASPGSPGGLIANPILLARSSMSSPSASEDETHLYSTSKRLTPVLPKTTIKSTTCASALIITSKGTLITTQSSPATSIASHTSSDSATTLVSSSASTSSVSSTTIPSNAKSSKNKKLAKKQNETNDTQMSFPSSKNDVAANANKILQQKPPSVNISPERSVAQVSSSSVSANVAVTPAKEKPTSAKREIIRMSPQKLAEMTRLGFIEEKPHGKVLTPSGVRKMQEQKLLSTKTTTAQSPITTQSVSVTEKRLSPLTTVVNEESEVVNSAVAEEVIPAAASSPISPNKKKTTLERDTPNTSSLVSPMLIASDAEDLLDKASCDTEDEAATTSNVTSDTQIAAIPAENFGGPPNAFYLCSVSEDGNLKPMKDKIYILDGVTSRLIAVDSDADSEPGEVEEEIVADPAVETVGTEQNEDIIEIPEVVGEDGEPAIVSGDPENPNILINIGDQQIVLDQQTLLTLASGGDISGEMPQLLNQDGQPLLLQGYAQEILAALSLNQSEHAVISDDCAEQQILLSADITGVVVDNQQSDQILASRVVSASAGPFESEQLLVAVGGIDGGGVLENLVVENQSPNLIDIIDPSINFQSINPQPAVQAHVSETNVVSAIMSARVSSPTSTKINSNGIGITSVTEPLKISSNLDESLAAVIGPTDPISLELPITITNPAIAPKVSNPMQLNPIYPNSMLPVAGLPLVTTTTIATPYDRAHGDILIDERIIAENAYETIEDADENVGVENSGDGQSTETEVDQPFMAVDKENHQDNPVAPESVNNNNNNTYNSLDDEIIPVTPESNGGRRDQEAEDDESTNSSEIPIQPNLVFRQEQLILNDGATGEGGADDEFSDPEPVNESNQNNFNLNMNNHGSRSNNSNSLIGNSR